MEMSQKGVVVAAAAGFLVGATVSGAIALIVAKMIRRSSNQKEYNSQSVKIPSRKDVFRQGERKSRCICCARIADNPLTFA
jgi:hypothetical protein